MNGRGKSDSSVVPTKPSNEGGTTAAPPAEGVEGRGLPKGNPSEQTRSRAQIRQDLKSALDRVRQAAVRDRGMQFTTLWHHVYNVERLREAYLGLKRKAAPGVDRVTWEAYGEEVKAELRRRLHDPVSEVGAYLRSVVQGHFRYYGVPRNGPALSSFRNAVYWLWWRSLRRRSQKHRQTRRLRRRFSRWAQCFLPYARIYHPYPEQRLIVTTRGRSPVR